MANSQTQKSKAGSLKTRQLFIIFDSNIKEEVLVIFICPLHNLQPILLPIKLLFIVWKSPCSGHVIINFKVEFIYLVLSKIYLLPYIIRASSIRSVVLNFLANFRQLSC